MTPEQKAKILLAKFGRFAPHQEVAWAPEVQVDCARYCALIAVEEILQAVPQKEQWQKETLKMMEAWGEDPASFGLPDNEQYLFWQQVKAYLINI